MSTPSKLAVAVAVVAVVLAGIPAAPASAQTGAGTCSFPVTRTDATGTDVTVREEPKRIVSLNPSAAQTLWEIGARKQVVGVTQFATYLEGAEEREVIETSPGSVDVERIVALEPDLVFAPGTISEETVDNLRSKGLTVFSFESPATIEAVAEKTTLFGRLTGHCDGAAETNAWMRQNVENVRTAVADEERPRAMYYFSDGYTVGRETFIHDVMTTAGTQNVMAAANVSGYAQANPEVVRERDPQWLILNSRDDELPTAPAYRETTAVRENQTVVVDVNYLNQPAPRSIVYAVRNLTEAIHPEAYESAAYVPRSAVESTATTGTDAGTTETDVGTTPDAQTATPADDGPGTSGSAPGFGAALAAVAMLAAGAIARRRR